MPGYLGGTGGAPAPAPAPTNTGWSSSAMDYYNQCRAGGATAAECETATNNYMLGGGGGFLQNTAGDLVAFLGGLGSTGANIYGQFSGTVPPGGSYPTPPAPAKQNNTILYILGGVILLVLIIVIAKGRK